ncbi:uncharacterized protein [Miscanthus floridulus]|uniref:uncharacterized protein n=1 Tax=Miscanthus floridulus TaxID=154761 RepID=UPI00345A219A
MEGMQQNMEAALRHIADNTYRGLNPGGHEANQDSSFKDFMDTRPPIFKEATEPLDAEEWINTMEDKFRVLRMTEVLKTEYAAHQLQEMKFGEFLALTQGTKTVTQYLHAFNNLSRYASDMVNTDAKKIASFKRGLNPKMMKHVGTNSRTGFNDFVSDCLKQEKNNNVYATSKTRKRAFESGLS